MKMDKYNIISAMIIVGILFIILMVIVPEINKAKCYSFDLERFADNGFQIESNSIVLRNESDGGEHHNSPRFCLRNGGYKFVVEYESDIDYSVTLYLDNEVMTNVVMPLGEGVATQTVYLEWPTDRAYLSFDAPVEGTVIIKSISISSDRMLYTDRIFQIIALTILAVILLFVLQRFSTYDNDKKTAVICITMFIIVVNLPLYVNIDIDELGVDTLFGPFDSVTRFGTDTIAQLMRLQGVMYGFLDHQFPVLIAPNFLEENGELQFMYPNISLYPFALLRLAGASMPLVFRWFSVACNILTIFAMYYSCHQISNDVRICLLTTALYTFEPHRLRVVLAKGAAMGMGLPYVFIPLAIAGLYLIIKKERKGIWLLAFGVTGVLESHITSLLLLMMLLVVTALSCFKELVENGFAGIKQIAISVGLCALMNLGFLTIFIYYYRLGLNTDALRWTSLSKHTLSPVQMITDVESLYYAVSLIIILIMLFLSKVKGADLKFSITLAGITFLLWSMTSSCIPYDRLSALFPPLNYFLEYMQKPHRFYTVMAGAVIISILILAEDISIKKGLLSTLVLVVIFTTGVEFINYLNIGWCFRDAVVGDINSVVTGDYLPVGTDLDMEFSGTARVSDESRIESLYYKKKGTTIDYHYIAEGGELYAEFPLITYDGYAAVDETGKSLEVINGENARLTVLLNGDKGEHAMHIEFVVKPIFKMLYSFSLLFSIISICFFIIRYKNGYSE